MKRGDGERKLEQITDTFALIHDDEFQALNFDKIEETKFRADSVSWRDSWKRKPAPVFRNHIRQSPPEPDSRFDRNKGKLT
jgi:hypothetical protein